MEREGWIDREQSDFANFRILSIAFNLFLVRCGHHPIIQVASSRVRWVNIHSRWPCRVHYLCVPEAADVHYPAGV